jgi:tripartite-type tricarboxylate transporter receptor subunit TctC
MQSVRRITAILAIVLLGCVCSLEHARAEYPDRPITFVVGAGAGGLNDIVARLYAEHMAQTLGQPIVVKDIPGAGTTRAVSAVTEASPDGYTVLVNGSPHSVIAALYPETKIDVLNDLDSVSMLAYVPLVLAVNKSVPADDLPSLITYLKANPDKLSFGTIGVGSGAYMAMELFRRMSHVDLVHVPYRTTPEALDGLLQGQVDMMFDIYALLGSYIKSGVLKPIAVSTLKRSQTFPDIPTFDEMGVKGFDASGWTGMYITKGTPKAIIDQLSHAVAVAAADPDLIKHLTLLGIEPPLGMGPDFLTEYLRQDVKKWTDVLSNVSK